MKDFYTRPQITQVTLKDDFWSPYIENFRNITIPYCFQKFFDTKYIQNFIDVAEKNSNPHVSFPFSDGLVLETITGTSNFLAAKYDKELDNTLDSLIKVIVSAQQSDGYLCTMTTQDYPDKRWGENGGDIVDQHDLYNHGTLIEAGIAHYHTTGKTTLLFPAIKAANLICSYIGEAPKHHIIPGHALPELAFTDLYRLFKTDSKMRDYAKTNGINPESYAELVLYWYNNRGDMARRKPEEISKYSAFRYQNTVPLGQMRQAVGHAVRAGLCYAGAASIYREFPNEEYKTALTAIWQDIISKKMHISGGVGSRADIEGFDMEYSLQNDAYLETCAGIALAFFAAEMSLTDKNSAYFDVFELSLYNNILGSMAEDFKKFYYDNPLVNDGTKNRWEWHDCPCCPPMLSKIYSSLQSYIYSYNKNELCVNLYIGSHLEIEDFIVMQHKNSFALDIKSEELALSFRVPAYAKNFHLEINGTKADFIAENGYATVVLKKGKNEIKVLFEEKILEICANTKVEADIGRVCIMKGPVLYCAEGIDNNGDTDFTLAENCQPQFKDGKITVLTASGKTAVLIPYHKRNNRVSENTADSKMSVWLKKENMKSSEIDSITNEKLYGLYNCH